MKNLITFFALLFNTLSYGQEITEKISKKYSGTWTHATYRVLSVDTAQGTSYLYYELRDSVNNVEKKGNKTIEIDNAKVRAYRKSVISEGIKD